MPTAAALNAANIGELVGVKGTGPGGVAEKHEKKNYRKRMRNFGAFLCDSGTN